MATTDPVPGGDQGQEEYTGTLARNSRVILRTKIWLFSLECVHTWNYIHLEVLSVVPRHSVLLQHYLVWKIFLWQAVVDKLFPAWAHGQFEVCFVGSILFLRSYLSKKALKLSFSWQGTGSLPYLLWHLTFQSCTVHCLPKTFPKTFNFKGYMDDNPFCHQKNSQIESHCKNNQLEADPSGVSPAGGKNLN